MPIQPTTFDRAFRDLGIDLVTLGHCSWDNYQRFNAALADVQRALTTAGVPGVRLIDAHSFCYMLKKVDEVDPTTGQPPRSTAGRVLGGRETAVATLAMAVEQTRRCSGSSRPRINCDTRVCFSSQSADRAR